MRSWVPEKSWPERWCPRAVAGILGQPLADGAGEVHVAAEGQGDRLAVARQSG
jgi:hypothetical protein